MRKPTDISDMYPKRRDAWDRYGIPILLVIGFTAALVIPW